MANFTYIALDTQHNPVSGKTEQADRASVIAALTKQGLRPVSIKEIVDKGAAIGFLSSLNQAKRVKSDQLVVMTRQLSAMISAGVPLLRALTSLESHSESPALKMILGDVVKNVEGGESFGDALSKHPEAFNDIYVNMVRAGESAGILDDILKRLAAQQEKSATLRKKIRSAMAYPMVLVFITVLAFFGLMLFVIPQIGNILKDLGGPDAELPLLTQVMLGISGFITTFWYIILPVIAAGVYMLLRYIRTKPGKRKLDSLLLKVPGIKTIIMKLAIARFARTFSALMGAGVAVLEALNVTARAVGNTLYDEALVSAAKEVKNGRSLASVIGQNPLFPAIVGQMLAVGEETGQTDTVLVKVADFYEEEVDVAIEGISSIIEPAMIVILGGMVGVIAASVMGPIAGLAQSIQ